MFNYSTLITVLNGAVEVPLRWLEEMDIADVRQSDWILTVIPVCEYMVIIITTTTY